ncbi:MAG: HD-GYP domain-containing protein [Neptuniibacter sp.]
MNFFSQTEKDFIQNTRTPNPSKSLPIWQLLSRIERFDPTTYLHLVNVSKLSTLIGYEMSLNTASVEDLRLAGLVHDIGKMFVPEEILNKPSSLSKPEYEIIKEHVPSGAEHLNSLGFTEQVVTIISQHHERLDGSGYPHGLAAEDILIESRVLAVADSLDAMAADRPYRRSLGITKSLEILVEEQGKTLDQDVIETVLKIHKRGDFLKLIEIGSYLS